MCYDIKQMQQRQIRRAIHDTFSFEEKDQLEKEYKQLELFDLHHVSGFQYPELAVISQDANGKHIKMTHWGLIPFWEKDMDKAMKMTRRNGLNARSETMFSKATFKYSAQNQRCLIYVDGFYEHHHHNGKALPFYISIKNDKSMILGGIMNRWQHKASHTIIETVSIVTCVGNNLLKIIHNNPKLEVRAKKYNDPSYIHRMPVILHPELADKWLSIDASDKIGQDEIMELCQPYDASEMEAYTVKPIRGKIKTGNVPAASELFEYPGFDYKKLIA